MKVERTTMNNFHRHSHSLSHRKCVCSLDGITKMRAKIFSEKQFIHCRHNYHTDGLTLIQQRNSNSDTQKNVCIYMVHKMNPIHVLTSIVNTVIYNRKIELSFDTVWMSEMPPEEEKKMNHWMEWMATLWKKVMIVCFKWDDLTCIWLPPFMHEHTMCVRLGRKLNMVHFF